tara:strand:+ start:326 stop:709 length:384 start_codon:yes stop_codon:yes gene_type:complete
MDNKDLNDFLPNKNTVYYKVFNGSFTHQIKESDIIEKIKKVLDPEIPVNIYDLGLIYNIKIDPVNNIAVEMTLTTPNCPVAGSMPENVGKVIAELKGLSSIKVSLVWEPKWNKDMMSEDAKLALDIF